MKHDTQLFAVPPAPKPTTLSVLSFQAERQIDPVPYQTLMAEKGVDETEELICRVLEDIALRLDILQLVVADHQFEEIAKQTRRIQQVALGIGLTSVQSIAKGAALAAVQQDGVAVHAIVGRLERSFDAAVSEIWEHRRT